MEMSKNTQLCSAVVFVMYYIYTKLDKVTVSVYDLSCVCSSGIKPLELPEKL